MFDGTLSNKLYHLRLQGKNVSINEILQEKYSKRVALHFSKIDHLIIVSIFFVTQKESRFFKTIGTFWPNFLKVILEINLPETQKNVCLLTT